MRTFDHDFVNDVIARLNRLKPGAKPRWGSMPPDRMIGHLIFWVKYPMGKVPEYPDVGTWFTRRIVGPLLLNGWLPIPRNLKAIPSNPSLPEPPPGDTETLHAVLETYLDLVQTGDLVPRGHPAFGEIGVDGWAKMHVVHFEHHLTQFGV